MADKYVEIVVNTRCQLWLRRRWYLLFIIALVVGDALIPGPDFWDLILG